MEQEEIKKKEVKKEEVKKEEVKKEEGKKEFDDLKEKSTQVFNAENQKKAMCFVDRLFGWIYRASCAFIVLLICLFSLILVGSVLYAIFHGPDSKLAPTYKEFSENPANKKVISQDVDTTSVDVNKQFGDELKQICKLTGKEPNTVVTEICGIPEKFRKAYVFGALDFLKDAEKSIGKDYKPETGNTLWENYTEGFQKNVDDIPNREKKAEEECKDAWMYALKALCGILVVLVLATLVRIEKNTRKE